MNLANAEILTFFSILNDVFIHRPLALGKLVDKGAKKSNDPVGDFFRSSRANSEGVLATMASPRLCCLSLSIADTTDVSSR
jgi:hypothetical protein